MPVVHFVEKARKDNPVAKKGESYYWWKFKFGEKHYSKTPPRPSQLTQSEFFSEVYSIQEEMEDATANSIEELEDMLDDWVNRIRDLESDCESKLNSMPDSLQQAATGELLQERADALEQWASDLENISLDREINESEGEAIGRLLGDIVNADCPL